MGGRLIGVRLYHNSLLTFSYFVFNLSYRYKTCSEMCNDVIFKISVKYKKET